MKQCWTEHLQGHFLRLEEKYNHSQKLCEKEAILCPDPRCALSFDSIQDFQFHCQDVHCVDRIKGDTAKKRLCTPRSKVDAKPDLYPNVEPKHRYAFIEEKFPSRCANEIKDMLALEPAGLVYSAGLIEPKEQSDGIRSRSPHSASSAYSASSKPPETDWHSQGVDLDINTPASSVISDSLFNIDPRLRDNSVLPATSTQ